MARREKESVNNLIPEGKPETPGKVPLSEAVRNTDAVPHQPDTRRSKEIDKDDQQRQLSSEADQEQNVQTVPKQLQSAQSEHLRPTECGTYESQLIRVGKERDEMKSLMDRHGGHMSEILATVRMLTAERDKTRMQYLQAQEEIAELQREVLRTIQGCRCSTMAQSVLKRIETERNNAWADLHHMTTERDSLKGRLKISQETAISDRVYLEQRMEDLHNTIFTLEQERAEEKIIQAEMREAIMGLEAQVNMWKRKAAAKDGEISSLKNECSMLRISNAQTENMVLETQKRLVSRIADLQQVQATNKQLDDLNDSLMKEDMVLKEHLNMMQDTVSNLTQQKDSLQEQLERKNDLLCFANKQLDDKENIIQNMKQQSEDLEASIQAVKEGISHRDQDLDVLRNKQLELEEMLKDTLKLNDTTFSENTQLRDELDQLRLDNKALQLKVDETTIEIESLGRQIQTYVSDISRFEDLLSTKEQECKELKGCKMELRASDLENRSLKDRVDSLESSLQEAINTKESLSAGLKQLKSTLKKHEEDLWQVQRTQLRTHQDLEKAHDLCIKLDTEKEAVQQELESCHIELELVRKQLGAELEKELHRQLSSQEKLIEIQILKDKLAIAESNANTQSREMAHLRTLVTLLETDLDSTRKQLNSERENTIMEIRRLSSSFSTPMLSSTMCIPPSPIRPSIRPETSDSPEQSPQEDSPDRDVTFEDI